MPETTEERRLRETTRAQRSETPYKSRKAPTPRPNLKSRTPTPTSTSTTATLLPGKPTHTHSKHLTVIIEETHTENTQPHNTLSPSSISSTSTTDTHSPIIHTPPITMEEELRNRIDAKVAETVDARVATEVSKQVTQHMQKSFDQMIERQEQILEKQSDNARLDREFREKINRQAKLDDYKPNKFATPTIEYMSDRFFRHLENYVKDHNGTSNESHVSTLKSLLAGKAKTAYFNLPDEIQNDYLRAKAALIAHFAEAERKIKITAFKQFNAAQDDIEDYLDSFYDIAQSQGMTDAQALDKLAILLPENLQRILAVSYTHLTLPTTPYV